MKISMGMIRMNAFIEVNELIGVCDRRVMRLEKDLEEKRLIRIVAGYEKISHEENKINEEIAEIIKIRGGLKFTRFRVKLQMRRKNAPESYS